MSSVAYRIYDGDECVADVDASGNPIRSYVWGQGIDDLLAVTVYTCQPNSPQPTASSYHAIKDHLGGVHALVDESGEIAAQFTYDAWGNLLSSTISSSLLTINSLRYLFQGREYSFATGLYNFRARWYDPATGRWLSKDPIGLEGGLNLYVFCGNDPVCLIDPFGLDALFLVGRNIIEPSYFTSKAMTLAKGYERYNSGEKAFVVQIRSIDDVQDALRSYKNINRIDYFGHGADGILELTDKNSLTYREVKKLDTSNTSEIISINLWSCGSAAGAENSIAQAFANHFGAPTTGATGGLSFGIPYSWGRTIASWIPRGTFDTRQPAQTGSGNPTPTFPQIMRPSDW